LWAALITMSHVPLATALLEAGANPTDGVTPQIAAGSGNIAALELLLTFGLNVNGTPGGVPPLVYMMQWSEDSSGARWLLEHGADPNLTWGPDHEAPLHVAARRWDLALVELLVSKGAAPRVRRADGYTAHTLAELHGNHDIAEWLLAHGAIDEMSPLDRFIAAAARGDGAAADALLRDHPGLPGQLTAAHHLMLQRPAEAGNAAALETMLARGFNPNISDKDGVTALHRAAMAGHRDAVATLIRFGARMDALDGMFSGTPLLWAVEGRNHAQPGSDHVGVARVLIEAGSPLGWTPPPGAPAPEKTLDGLRELRRDAAAAAR
jgi:ankyrin repeat protein